MKVNITGRGRLPGVPLLPVYNFELSEQNIRRFINMREIRIFDSGTGFLITRGNVDKIFEQNNIVEDVVDVVEDVVDVVEEPVEFIKPVIPKFDDESDRVYLSNNPVEVDIPTHTPSTVSAVKTDEIPTNISELNELVSDDVVETRNVEDEPVIEETIETEAVVVPDEVESLPTVGETIVNDDLVYRGETEPVIVPIPNADTTPVEVIPLVDTPIVEETVETESVVDDNPKPKYQNHNKNKYHDKKKKNKN